MIVVGRFFFRRILPLLLVCASITGCSGESTPSAEAIRSVMDRQVTAWNDGDIEGYMQGYWRSDSLRFASGGTAAYGWETTLGRYRRGYPDREAMGDLSFDEVDVDMLSSDHALVFGRWNLVRNEMDSLGGLFTLLFRRTPDGWRIIHDHTSSN